MFLVTLDNQNRCPLQLFSWRPFLWLKVAPESSVKQSFPDIPDISDFVPLMQYLKRLLFNWEESKNSEPVNSASKLFFALTYKGFQRMYICF